MPNDQHRSFGNDETIRMDEVSRAKVTKKTTSRQRAHQPQLTEAQREAAMRARRAQQQSRAQLEMQAQAQASQEMQRKQKKKDADDARAMKAYRENQARQEAERQARLEAEAARLEAEAAEEEKRAKKQAKKEKSGGLFKKKASKKNATQIEQPKNEPKADEQPKKKRKGLGCLTSLLIVLVALCVAFGALWVFRSHQTVTPLDQIPESERAAVAAERERQNVYMLMAGTDAREGDEAARSDTIIYAVFRQADRKIEMVSIPRDTLVDIPNNESGKINAALAYGGMELLVNTVENFLDSPVDHTMLIDFSSFSSIVDAMGGITIEVPEKMYLPEEGIDLEPGKQKLNGHDALAFVRWRGDGTGDLGRIQRQGQFMNAMIDKMTHLTPWAAVRTAFTIRKEIQTDMSIGEMLGLAWSFIGMSGDDLEFQAFQVNPTYINDVSFVLIDSSEVNRVVQTMRYGMVMDGVASSDTSYDTYSDDTYSYDYSNTGYTGYDNSYSNEVADNGAVADSGGYDGTGAGADTGGGVEVAPEGGAESDGGGAA